MTDLLRELLRCQKWIENALEYAGGTHDFVHIVEGVLQGRFQFWPAQDGCIVTEIIVYPKKKVLHIFLAGGELNEILDMEQSLISWGLGQGCETMTLAGRGGWKRVLASREWKPAHTVLSKELTDE